MALALLASGNVYFIGMLVFIIVCFVALSIHVENEEKRNAKKRGY